MESLSFLKMILLTLLGLLVTLTNADDDAWRSCDSVPCNTGSVCIMRKLTCISDACKDMEPLPICVPAHPDINCAHGYCDLGYKCVHIEMPLEQCESSQCYPMPVCVLKSSNPSNPVQRRAGAFHRDDNKRNDFTSMFNKQNIFSNIGDFLKCLFNPRSCTAPTPKPTYGTTTPRYQTTPWYWTTTPKPYPRDRCYNYCRYDETCSLRNGYPICTRKYETTTPWYNTPTPRPDQTDACTGYCDPGETCHLSDGVPFCYRDNRGQNPPRPPGPPGF